MLDPRARELARKLLGSAFTERREAFGDEIKRIRREVAPKGKQVDEATKASIVEARARFERAWEILRSVTTSLNVPPSETLADDLKQELGEVHLGDLRHAVDPGYRPDSPILRESWTRERQRVETAIAEAKRKVEADIELAVEAARRQAEVQRSQPSGAPVTYNYNITGPTFGVLQAGPNATATVVQSVGPEAKVALLGALDRFERDLEAAPTNEVPEKFEVAKAIQNIRAEVEKPNASRFNLRMWLSGLAEVVRTAASLRGAYEILRPAAAYFGIQLPPLPH